MVPRQRSNPVVDPALLAAIRWQRVNLLDGDAIAALGAWDAIVCRNVLIYFRDAVAARVVRSLENALRPDGVLLVGVFESLVRIGTSLTRRERRSCFFFERTS